jgi:cation transport regulator ChaB
MTDPQARGSALSSQYYKMLIDLMTFSGKGAIKVPTSYHQRVKEVKKLIEVDNTGLATTLTSFQINAATVPINIETQNKQLTKILDAWSQTVNFKMKMVETGLQGLMGQYYKERWQGSSFIVLKTVWENVGGFNLPVQMYLLDGGSIYSVKEKGEPIIVGNPKYEIRYGSKETDKEPIVDNKNIKYFFQNPFGTWGEIYPSPYIINRGIYYNQQFLNEIKEKGASVIKRAIEHIFALKKGFKEAVLQDKDANIYDKTDLERTDKDLRDVLDSRKYTEDMTTYTSNFDTEMEHIIPEYKRILNAEVIVPAEKGLLSSLGFVEMYSMQTRKEEVFNPKPFMAEAQDGINDFVSLIGDVVYTIIEENRATHPKYSNVEPIKINTGPMTTFIDSEAKKILRSIYDRGGISKRTLTEIGAGCDFDIELNRITQEKKDGVDKVMSPNPIQVSDTLLLSDRTSTTVQKKQNEEEDIPDDKQSIETRNFEVSQKENGKIKEDLVTAPYDDISELPDTVKVLPDKAKKMWMEVFNSVYKNKKDETIAIKSAWSTVKKYFKKNKDGSWVQKEKANLDTVDFNELLDVQKLTMLSKQNKLLDKILKENENETI